MEEGDGLKIGIIGAGHVRLVSTAFTGWDPVVSSEDGLDLTIEWCPSRHAIT